MKKILVLSFFLFAGADVCGAWETGKPPLQPEYYFYSETDFWGNLWMGYSFCSLEEIRKSASAWKNSFPMPGTTATLPNMDAFNFGIEGGWLFDGLNGFSISGEALHVSQSSFFFTNPSLEISQLIQPNLYSVSLNYYHFIDQKADAQTYLCAGAGYYLGSQNFAQYVYSSGQLANFAKGVWEGDTWGATLGAGARINVGKRFGVQLDARGRYADIPRVRTPYKDINTTKTYTSVLTVGSNGVIGHEPEDGVGVNGNTSRFLNFDFSGFDLNIGVFYHF